jgi:radical SAM-linked protein
MWKRVRTVAETATAGSEQRQREVNASVPGQKFRYLLRFTKNGPLRFIGHLDLLRVFQLTVRRAGWPVAYSQGFNPHQLISFALPLPLGMAGENDYAEIFFTEVLADCGVVLTRFNDTAPSGLKLTLLTPFPDGPGVAACTSAADYIYEADVSEQVIDGVLSRDELIIPKKTKSGVKDTDIRPDIRSIKKDGAAVLMRLSAGSQRFLNPLTVAGLLSPVSPEAPRQGLPASPEAPHSDLPASPEAPHSDLPVPPDAGRFTRAELYRLSGDGALVPLSVLTDV